MVARCKKGTRRNKKTGMCESNTKKSTVPSPKKAADTKKRCPNGTRRNKKTGNCESSNPKPPTPSIPSPPASKEKSKRMSKEESDKILDKIVGKTYKGSSLEGLVVEDIHFKRYGPNKKNSEIAITNANLKHSYWKNVEGLFKNHLSNNDFSESEMINVDFRGAYMAKSNFSGCSMTDVQLPLWLGDCKFDGATLTNVTIHPDNVYTNMAYKPGNRAINPYFTDFKKVTLKNLTFSHLYKDDLEDIKTFFTEDQLKHDVTFVLDDYEEEEEEYDEEEDEDDNWNQVPSPPSPPSPPPTSKAKAKNSSPTVLWTNGAKSTVTGCPSQGLAPSRDCKNKKKQFLVFHPDKNLKCFESASEKMKKLNNYCP